MRKLKMAAAVLVGALGLGVVPAALADGGMVLKQSAHDVKTTGDRLVSILEKKGLTVFTRIDHAAGAKSVGMKLRPTQMVMFGNPKFIRGVGTTRSSEILHRFPGWPVI